MTEGRHGSPRRKRRQTQVQIEAHHDFVHSSESLEKKGHNS